MALVNNNKIKEVGRILAEIGGRLAVFWWAAHEGLKDGEKQAGIRRHTALFANVPRFDTNQSVFCKRSKRGEIIVRLRGERVSVGQKQDTRAARRCTVCVPLSQIPTSLKELPGDLKGNRSLARTGSEGKQDTIPACGDGVQRPVYGDLLIKADYPASALVRERHCGEAVVPCVRLGKRLVPEFNRAGVARHLAFLAGLHINAVDTLSVGRIGVADGHLFGVILRLTHALC